MEDEFEGRRPEERILIDEAMIENRRFISILIAGEPVKVAVPDYTDYFIMKVVSSKASDIRDIASLIHELGISSDLRRVRWILPHPESSR